MKKHKAIKVRLMPDRNQEEMFSKTFGCCRKIWNLMLATKTENYKKNRKFGNPTPAQYKEEYPFLKEVDSLALANVQIHLNTAFKNTFESGAGFPKFKNKKTAKPSYTTNNQNGTVSISDGKLRLPKVGYVRAKLHRQVPDTWVLKSATISLEAGKYVASLLYEYEEPETVRNINMEKCIGLDYASSGMYVSSEGTRGDYEKYYRKAEKKLARLQRQLSKKKGFRKGEMQSENFRKQKDKIAKLQRHTANQRKDFLHKRSTEIANSYDLVCIEDLDMRAMSNKGFGNGKATMDNGWGMFTEYLSYKLADRGKQLVRIDKWYPSSQLCHKCGHKQPMPLNVRVYRCPECGEVIDRDVNAAINIKNEGIRIYLAS